MAAATAGGGASPGSGASLEEECEVVRVRVKKSEGQQPPEFRSFAVDPQITSLDVLQHILARAFDLQGKKSFALSFAARDGQGQDTFVPLLSDGDLANAFTCARPTLRLRLDVRNPPESPLLEDWDIISPREVAAAEPVPERRSLLAAALPFVVWRYLLNVFPSGLTGQEHLSHLGSHFFPIFQVVWRYLLNVFPSGLTGQERLSHLRLKAAEYLSLKAALAARAAPAELSQVAAAVRKDVVRTDRAHPYFGGPEEGHPHLAALQALLTTFALGHPHLSYCQGMSDVAAPLLAVLDDEAQAYLCFCSLMRRLAPRFRPGGRGLARAFCHLRRLLRRADPVFWSFLASRGAHDLLFCYRWLLLELKREFAFEDALRLLEITWSSLPPAPPPPPAGVPLLGPPLGARRAGRGLRERRGLRPRPPRRRRRRRRKDGDEDGEGDAPQGSAGGLGGLNDVPEGPKGAQGVQEGPESAGDVPDGPQSTGGGFGGLKGSGDVQESPRSFGDVPEGPGDIQEGPKSSRNVPESPKSSSDIPEGHKDIQEDLESSRNVPEGLKSSSDIPEGSKDIQEGPKSFKNLQEGAESSKNVPKCPRSSGDIPEGPKDIQEGPKSSSGVPKGPKSSRNVPKGPKSSRNTQGRPPRAGEAPEGPQDSGPGGPRKVEEGTDALEMEQRAHGPGWGDREGSSSSCSSCSSSSSSSDEELTVEDDGAPLPPPEELGQGNPFLLFVCLAMLLEQREAVMARAGDYNEVAMHFDRLVRRHQLGRVLRRAKGLFARYLEGWGGAVPGGPQNGASLG
ncbi:TBC1 domain family member 25-like [Malurus melanocephalus]|uniref:TBC1 domain family member 25-like n=1 Tax=Malurus melanocephalus TaxID=175006 RepID=UPI002546F748|nr:TBC1 domain family member 25-like [Malurus melanocephalus]